MLVSLPFPDLCVPSLGSMCMVEREDSQSCEGEGGRAIGPTKRV